MRSTELWPSPLRRGGREAVGGREEVDGQVWRNVGEAGSGEPGAWGALRARCSDVVPTLALPVGRRQPQCDRDLATGEAAGLPRITARRRGMCDATSARRAGQHRAASARAVGANLGTMADDGSRSVDQG